MIRFTKLGVSEAGPGQARSAALVDGRGEHADRAAEFGRRARITPRPQGSSISPQKGLALSAEESVAVVASAGRAEARDLRAKMPSLPRCREANGGVAVVAAGAAVNRNGGHHAEVEHP